MNPINFIVEHIEALVAATPQLRSALPAVPGWIDYGLPSEFGPPTCVRLDGLFALDDKLNRYSVNVKLWSDDNSGGFFELVEAFRSALARSNSIAVQGYIHQPDEERNCALFPVTFAA